MPSLEQLLTELERAKREFTPDSGAQVSKLLAQIGRKNFLDAERLIRFHEALLFLRAHPHSYDLLRQVDDLFSTFGERVERLRAAGAEMIAFDYIEYSGIARTTLSGQFSYGLARRLVKLFPQQVSIDWAKYDKPARLGLALPRVVPLLYEDTLVEANIPLRQWLEAAKGKQRDLVWLIRQFERLPITEREKIETYDLLELPIRWQLDDTPASRTRNISAPRKIFCHTAPLIRRSEVSLERELDASPISLQLLSEREGEKIIDRCRTTVGVRYRELYGITYGGNRQVVRATVGRGVELFFWGLPPDRRLPLRAYHAGFTLKNGVPINYIEGLTLFDRMEVGFNTFYTFREGESAWVYAKALKLLHQIAGATCFSIDPYQLGHHNDEAIESGAFWFYRKLGFRPTRADLLALVEREEKRLATRSTYRSSARVLRRLAEKNALYEHQGAGRGDWDSFHIRNLGLAVQRRMATQFDGDEQAMRAASMTKIGQALGLQATDLSQSETQAFVNLSLVWALIPNLQGWTAAEKSAAIHIIRAKAGADEAEYTRQLQAHRRLRSAIIRLGSQEDGGYVEESG